MGTVGKACKRSRTEALVSEDFRGIKEMFPKGSSGEELLSGGKPRGW